MQSEAHLEPILRVDGPFPASLGKLATRRRAGALAESVRRLLSLELPAEGRSTGGARWRLQWWEPGAWLMKGDPSDHMVLIGFGEQINLDVGLSFVDLSAAYEVFVVEGPLTREFLSCGCLLDVWSPDFGMGTGVRTRFGPFDVALDMTGAERCEMLVARSMVIDAKNWLGRRAASLMAASQQGRL